MEIACAVCQTRKSSDGRFSEKNMDVKLLSQIAELVAANPGQMNMDEYGEIATEISKVPCRVLVFGCGNDTPLWLSVNAMGKTMFIEHSHRWASSARAKGADVTEVTYRTRIENHVNDLNSDVPLGLAMYELANWTGWDWDVVIVDGPPGAGKGAPGRLQSIYEASRLCGRHGVVFVHDMHRQAEKAATKALLVERGGFVGKRITDKLWEFRRK